MDFLKIDTIFPAILRCGLIIFGCTAILISPTRSFATETNLLNEINHLDNEFRKVSAMLYNGTSRKNVPQIGNINKLLQLANQSIKNSDDITAIRLLYRNKSLVMDNVDNKAVFTFINLLLRNNEWSLANTIFTKIQDEGDRSLKASANFIFAKYYTDRNEWAKTDNLLTDIFSELSANDASYAYLLKGVALQELKKHRQAITYYRRIPQSSKYYREAQLNTAIVNIRQGWWTDANNIIKKVTEIAGESENDETLNRSHLVLGYALLQREYYRNARDEFRKVTLNSRYTNRALLGIGLTAANQGDYVGGLNALSILKDKKNFDLSTDESYLLLPYVYDKLQQEVTVTASYTEAMNYYKKRIHSLEQLMNKHKTFAPEQYDFDTMTLTISDNHLDYGDMYPESFLKNYKLLLAFVAGNEYSEKFPKTNDLLRKHDVTFQKVVNTLLEQRLAYLKSYLNQSRYGFARFLDSTNRSSDNE